MKLRFDSIPHSFSIMKKRAISIIAGDGSHFISYLAVDFGAHSQEENSTNRDSTFIANINSGDGSANMNPFIQWLFAVMYELEVWVAQFLKTSALSLIERPYLAKIGRMQAANTIEGTHCLLHSHYPRYTSANSRGHMQLRHLFVAQYTGCLFGRLESPREMEQGA
jgi:hypothetical protein